MTFTPDKEDEIAKLASQKNASVSKKTKLLEAGAPRQTATSITPPSEVRRPPSNAAASFLRPTAGKQNGSPFRSADQPEPTRHA
jgi:hypothetical protein